MMGNNVNYLPNKKRKGGVMGEDGECGQIRAQTLSKKHNKYLIVRVCDILHVFHEHSLS